MRRLSSTYASGSPGVGILLLRLIAGITLIVRCLRLHDGASLQAITPHVVAAGVGLLILAGLWTAVAGPIVAIIELLIPFSHGDDPWVSVLLAGLGIALALLGPGAWSVDARRSGWKRIEIRQGKRD